MQIKRRMFLRAGVAAVAASSLPVAFLFARRARAAGFGALVADPAGILDLPPGFSYRILERQGDPMSDGYRVPGSMDAMACFAGPNNTLILMRNHEVSTSASAGPYGSGQQPPSQAYNPAMYGGVTRLVLNATTFNRISSNLVLVGTNRNCAGGMSPWGWLSCEEAFTAQHGYVFVCPTDATTVRAPQRIIGYGHFNHEAATTDPRTSICYLTEDRSDSSFYRFVPTNASSPFNGRLQALRIRGQNAFDTNGMTLGQTLDVDWVDIADPNPASDTIRFDVQAQGAAIVRRGEGIWFHEGIVYVVSTSGGPAGGGQIFAYTPANETLKLVAHSTNRNILDGPDNITVAPWNEIYIAEDGSSTQFVRGITLTGEVFDFARNRMSGDSEFTGVCFSPDGKAMFVNVQDQSYTFVITGPFPTVPPPTDGGTGQGGTGGQAGAGGSSGQQGGAGQSGSAGQAGAAGQSGSAGQAGAAGQGGLGQGGSVGASGATGIGGQAGGSAGAGGRLGSAGIGGNSGSGRADAGNQGRPIVNAEDEAGCGCSVPPRRSALGGVLGGAAALFGALIRRSGRSGNTEPAPDDGD